MTFSEAYNLPVYLRNFYIHQLIEMKEEAENNAANSSSEPRKLPFKK